MRDRTLHNRFVAWAAGHWRKTLIRRSLKICWIGFVSLFVALAVARSWEHLRVVAWTPHFAGIIVLSFLVALTRRLAGGLLWTALIRMVCPDRYLPTFQSLRYYFISNLATYLPGSYWNVPSLIVLHKRQGVSAIETGTALVLFNFLNLLSGGLLGILGFQVIAKVFNIPGFMYAIYLIVIVLGGGLIHPTLFNIITRWIFGIFHFSSVDIKVDYLKMVILLIAAVAIWLLGAISLLFEAHAIAPVIPLTFSQVGVFSAIFAISWIVGFFVPFAPNGLGVREGMMGLSFGFLGVSVELGIIIAALSRIIIILEDVFWGGLSVLKKEKVDVTILVESVKIKDMKGDG